MCCFCRKKEFRNKNLGHELFKKHIEIGIENNCKRAFLEVIKENKAKSFYIKEGYKILGELFYYSLDLNTHSFENNISIDFKPITNHEINDYLNKNSVHINYQNHPIILKKSEENKYYQLVHQGKTIGVIAYDPTGNLSILYLIESYRKLEYLNSIFDYFKSNEKFEKINLSVTSEMNYVSLFKAIGFKKDAIDQFEMVKKL